MARQADKIYGHWISRNDEWFNLVECSVCGKVQSHGTETCENCHSTMIVCREQAIGTCPDYPHCDGCAALQVVKEEEGR